MAQPFPDPFAPVTRSGPPWSDGAKREQAVTPLLPHRMAQVTRDQGMIDAINERLASDAIHTSINAPSFADYFDEYARMAVGIVGFGTLALGLFAWATA